MEIEAKFRIPDEDRFQQLLAAPALAGLELDPPRVLVLEDRYLDTSDGRFLAAGYACRLRWQDGLWLATLKGLGGAVGAIHRRQEEEVQLPGPLRPHEWPSGAARDLALEVAGDEPLRLLFQVEQTRHARPAHEGERLVAHLNLDRVRVSQADRVIQSYLELEIELAADGYEEDLARLATEVQEIWGLPPEPRSKFERALEAVAPGAEMGLEPEAVARPHLTGEERAILERLAAERPVISRRARLLLAWDEGASVAEMVERSGLSPRRARYWRHVFPQRRLGIFPRRALGLAREVSPAAALRPTAAVRKPLRDIRPSDEAGLSPEMAEQARRPGIEPDDPMSEAGRKTLRFHHRRMLLNEPGTRRGEDIEALHDMRVATRRMRAAFRVFGDYYQPREIAPFLKGLRRTGRALGAVRDLDVFRERVQAYLQTLPESQRGCLDGFLAQLNAERQLARERMLAYLDGEPYQRFVERFGTFVETAGMGSRPVALDGDEPRPYRVRHVAPMAIYEWLAVVRAYDEWVTVPNPPLARLHALRIACKRLRYTLEFFEEVLGPETRGLVKDIIAVQDHLGLVQDGIVASGILRDFLVWGAWGSSTPGRRQGAEAPVMAPGVATYLAVRQSEVLQLVESFPAVWRRITDADFGRRLAAAVAVL